MEDAFATLVWVVAGAGVVVALITLAGTARQYREIGGSGLTHDSDGPAATSAGGAARRGEGIRHKLAPRDRRRARQGDPADARRAQRAPRAPGRDAAGRRRRARRTDASDARHRPSAAR